MDASDHELLSRFAANRCEDAFHALVSRHLPMVLSVARRHLGEAHQAEEVAQNVFLLLARKASMIGTAQSIGGWLHQSTRHEAANCRRSESRRVQREQAAARMSTPPVDPPAGVLLEALEDAMTDLDSGDRDVLILRFMEDRQLRDVGRELGVGEEAARKRVARALERLREVFRRRGLATSVGTVTAALSVDASASVPAGLVLAITKSSLAGSALAPVTGGLWIQHGTMAVMKSFNLKSILVVAVLLAGTSVCIHQQRELDRQRAANEALEVGRAEDLTERQRLLAERETHEQQVARWQSEGVEVRRLRAEVSRLTRELEARRADSRNGAHPTVSQASASSTAAAPEDWKQSIARIRSKLLQRGEPPTPEELKWLQDAKPKIEQLERDPVQFSAFQSELVKATVPSIDGERQKQIEAIVRETYETAVATNLDLPSKPAGNAAAEWVARRHALDRAGTEKVQGLLTPSEREQFDRRFLGIMGVDLGTGVDKANYPPGFLGDVPPTP